MTTVDWDPSTRTLRQFAGAGGVFLAGMATVVHAHGGREARVVFLVSLAVALAATGAILPRVLRLPYVLLTLAASPIGAVTSHLILLVLFFGVITPLGILSRVVRPDPLGMRWDLRAQSYWQSRPRPRDLSSYLRQA